jgi:hypothetical protein
MPKVKHRLKVKDPQDLTEHHRHRLQLLPPRQ